MPFHFSSFRQVATTLALCLAAGLAGLAGAQTAQPPQTAAASAAPPTVRLRGTVQSVTPNMNGKSW